MTELLTADLPPDSLEGEPAGTVVEMQPGVFLVMGDRGKSYGVRPDEGTCECPYFQYQLLPKGGALRGHRCKHLDWVYEWLITTPTRLCPVCLGNGAWRLEPETIGCAMQECGACEGNRHVAIDTYDAIMDAGLTAKDDWLLPDALPSDEELRKVFA